jgi:hypothetical protein
MSNFQEKYFEAINSLMSAQEENYKLKNELCTLKETNSSLDKLEKTQEALIESLDVNAKLEAKVAQLKKDKVSTLINYKREIAALKDKIQEFTQTFNQINGLNSELLTEGKCILCARSCNCHLTTLSPAVVPVTASPAQKLKFKKSTTIPTAIVPVKTQENLKENVEKIKPKNAKLKSLSKLISWRSVVKNSRPKGTLTFLPKKTTIMIEERIMNDFLVDRVEKELLVDCKVDEGSKSVPGIPESLVEEFDPWLGILAK